MLRNALLLVPLTMPLAADAAVVKILDPWARVDKKETAAAEGLKVMALAAPRNGFAAGQVAVYEDKEIPGVTAAAGDLKGPAGATIPASAVRVRYGRAETPMFALVDAPVEAAKAQVVWITAQVPADAKPGAYAGTLRIAGLNPPVAVPVELTVFGWTVASPKDWKTSVNLLQSPESVAGHYKVPLWSDAHFKLIEKSLQLMAEGGNDVFGVSVVAWNQLGNDPAVVFRKEGGAFAPEFKYLDRYLDLYNRIVGKPKFFAVHAWTWGGRGDMETGDEPVRVLVLEGDKLVNAELPPFGGPGAEALWRAVFDGIRERVKKLGWREEGILLGTSGDSWPRARTIEFFNKVAPSLEWRVLTHGVGCPKWGVSRDKRVQPNGMVVGYLEIARWIVSRRAWQEDHPVVSNSRDHVGQNPFDLFALPAFNASGGYFGYCWKGLDYWTYTTPEGAKRNALNTYVGFGNVVGGTPRALTVPGPGGALRTPQFEMMREGAQVHEALWAIRDNLAALYAQPTVPCDVAELFLPGALKKNAGHEGAEVEFTLIFHGDAILVRPYAPRWNSSGVGSGQAKAVIAKEGARYEIEFTQKDDQWVPGGTGRFVVEAKLDGETYTGSYKGSFKGLESAGKIRGSFNKKGYALTVGEPPPKTELSKRCDEAIEEFFKAANLDKRRPLKDGELRSLFTRLYALAAETAEALAVKKK
jgi:hypothetical protein